LATDFSEDPEGSLVSPSCALGHCGDALVDIDDRIAHNVAGVGDPL